MLVIQGPSGGFSVNMNRGKLTQVFDNLVLNAEYWLREAIRSKAVNSGKITLVLDAPVVRVRDNGWGVEVSVGGVTIRALHHYQTEGRRPWPGALRRSPTPGFGVLRHCASSGAEQPWSTLRV